MEKFFKFLFLGAFALFAFASCSDDEENVVNPDNQGVEYDEAYYASHATVSSSDSQFTSNGEGGAIAFKTEGGSVVVDVDCGTPWTAQNPASDVFGCTVQSASITVTAEQNLLAEERTGSITLMTTTSGIEFATITITQGVAEAYITLSTTQLSFDGNENETAVTVESNFDWEYATEASWITLTKATDGTALTVKVAENDSDANREGTVTVTAGTGTNTAEAQITVIQAYLETDHALILTYTTPSANTVVVLPLYGTVNCTVNWGDGVIETVTTSNPSHTYAAAGDYEVKVEGTVTQLYSNNIDQSSLDCLTSVTSWGDMEFTSMQYAFYNCSNLKSLPEVTGNAMLNVTSFAHAFHSCTSLETVPPDLTMNCSKLTTVQYIFDGCTSLKNGPSFAGCSALTTASYVFYECSSLTTTPEGMLSGCTKVTTLAYLFYKCPLLTDDNVRAGMFDDCTAVTTFLGAFWNCSSLTKIPDKLFDNNTKVTTFSYTFYGCSGLTSIPAGLFDYAPGVTTFLDVFYNCSGLTSIPDGLFDYNTEVTTFGSAFYKCSAMTTVPTGLFDHNLKVTTFSYTFYGCSSVSGESPYILLSDGTTKVHLYDRANYLSELGCVEPTTTGNCFSSSTFSDINSIPSSWGGKGN